MIGLPAPTANRAERILREVFREIRGPFAFRLWDGREVRFGQEAPACVAVIKAPETFLRLIRNPSPDNFGEAYVAGDIDLEGDLFSVMEVANSVEQIRLGPATKLRLLASLWRP
jgi:cyclopropane-fatty-acyl-phospholipid synthase